MKYKTILIDPPWQQKMSGNWKKHKTLKQLQYPTMNLNELALLPIKSLSEEGCHLWLWTTNQFLQDGFKLLDAWEYKYLSPIHWIKPSGIGNYFIQRTQTLLFAYYKKCIFPMKRYQPNIFYSSVPKRHSEKPRESYELIESISPTPRIELFARTKRENWDVWGNEVQSDIQLYA